MKKILLVVTAIAITVMSCTSGAQVDAVVAIDSAAVVAIDTTKVVVLDSVKTVVVVGSTGTTGKKK